MELCDSKNKLAYLNLATVYTNSQSQDVWWFQCNLIDSEMQLMAHRVLPPLLAIALMQDISHEKGRLLQPNKPAWRLTLRPRIELVLWFDFVLLAPSLSTRQRHCALPQSNWNLVLRRPCDNSSGRIGFVFGVWLPLGKTYWSVI